MDGAARVGGGAKLFSGVAIALALVHWGLGG